MGFWQLAKRVRGWSGCNGIRETELPSEHQRNSHVGFSDMDSKSAIQDFFGNNKGFNPYEF
jgi:hypothetical protein